jgi:Recombinase
MNIRPRADFAKRKNSQHLLLALHLLVRRIGKESMPRIERVREVLSGPLSPSYIEMKTTEGWKPVVVVWEREVEGSAPEPANIAEPVPYGLKISEDCLRLEQDIVEKEALVVMLEMIVQDKPLSEIAEALNARGMRTRNNTKWTPGSVFDMLPRLIEVGPRVFSSEEWVVRRGRLMNVV